ncbi:MAG TPA: type II toxin-antitoxin system VapC family toxin [Terracidiphilus sp.]|nr:type II toxin-antitoxin system VapC family toxin [Terracidiphilus sp.]
MSGYLLDSNVISNSTKPVPSASLAAWMADQDSNDLFLATITIGELWRGILELPAGRKRRELEEWFQGPEGLLRMFAGRILSLDAKAGLIWGRLMAEGGRTGRPRSAMDMLLAAIAEANNRILVTDNEKHFAGLKFINPMRASV